MVLKVLSETLTECVYCTGTKVGLSVGELSSGGKVLQKLLILAIFHIQSVHGRFLDEGEDQQ